MGTERKELHYQVWLILVTEAMADVARLVKRRWNLLRLQSGLIEHFSLVGLVKGKGEGRIDADENSYLARLHRVATR